jgi:hypothetical protein
MFVSKCTKKNVSDFPVTNQTLPGREWLNYSPPGRFWLVTARLGTGKLWTFFYSVQLLAMWNDRQFRPINTLIFEHDPWFSCAGRWWSEGRPCEARLGPASAASKASHRWISTSGWLREQRGWREDKIILPMLAGQCCGTETVGTITFCLSGSGYGSGTGTGFKIGIVTKWNHKKWDDKFLGKKDASTSIKKARFFTQKNLLLFMA